MLFEKVDSMISYAYKQGYQSLNADILDAKTRTAKETQNQEDIDDLMKTGELVVEISINKYGK